MLLIRSTDIAVPESILRKRKAEEQEQDHWQKQREPSIKGIHLLFIFTFYERQIVFIDDITCDD